MTTCPEKALLEQVIEGGLGVFPAALARQQARRAQAFGGLFALAERDEWAPALEHRLNALNDDRNLNTRKPRNLAHRVALESLHFVLGNREDAGIDGIADLDGHG